MKNIFAKRIAGPSRPFGSRIFNHSARKILSTAVISLTPWTAAAENTEQHPASADLASLPEVCELTGEFSQTKTLPSFDAPIIAKGDFFYSCTLGLIWRTSAPIKEAYVYPLEKSAAKITFENAFETLDSRAQQHLGSMLNNLMGGNRKYLEKTFKASKSGDALVLTPRKRRMRKLINTINILRSNGDARITMFQRNGENIVLDIINPQEHEQLNLKDCTERYAFSVPSCQYLYK